VKGAAAALWLARHYTKINGRFWSPGEATPASEAAVAGADARPGINCALRLKAERPGKKLTFALTRRASRPLSPPPPCARRRCRPACRSQLPGNYRRRKGQISPRRRRP